MMMIKDDYVAFLVHLAVGTGEIRGSSSVEFGSEFLFVCLFVFFLHLDSNGMFIFFSSSSWQRIAQRELRT